MTINFSMVPGIVTGVVLSILVLLYKSAYPHIAVLGRLKGQMDFRNIKRFNDLEIWEDQLLLRIDAPLTFINIQYVKDYLEEQVKKQDQLQKIIIDASAISHLDATANEGLLDILESLDQKSIRLVFAEVVGPVRDAMYKTGLLQRIGIKNIFLTLNEALESKDDSPYENRDRAIQHGLITEEEGQ